MAQPVRALTAFLEGLGLVPSTHEAAHHCLELQFDTLFWPLSMEYVCGTQTLTQAKHPQT